MKGFLPLLLLVLALAAATPSRSIADKKFKSSYVDLVMGSAMTPTGGRPSILVGLANRKDVPLWVRVRFQSAAGVTSCDSTRRVEPKRSAMYACEQDTLLADTEYPFTVSVYTDSTLATAVDEGSTAIHFRRSDLKEFAELNEAMQLPKTYDNVVHTEKLGLGAMLGPGGNGDRVTVNPDGLECEARNGPIRIAASQMRAVRMVDGGSNGPWVAVDYDLSGERRMLALRPSLMKGSTNVYLMRTSIETLLSSTSGK